MMATTDSTTPNATEAGVFALLALMGTAKADEFKAQLDKWVAARTAAEAAMQLQRETTNSNASAMADIAGRRQALNEITAKQERAAADIAAAKTKLANDQSAFAAASEACEAEIATRESSVRGREERAIDRDRDLVAREDAIGAREAAAEAMRSQAEATIAQFRAILPGSK